MAQYPTRKESAKAREDARNTRARARFVNKNAHATDGAVKSLAKAVAR